MLNKPQSPAEDYRWPSLSLMIELSRHVAAAVRGEGASRELCFIYYGICHGLQPVGFVCDVTVKLQLTSAISAVLAAVCLQAVMSRYCRLACFPSGSLSPASNVNCKGKPRTNGLYVTQQARHTDFGYFKPEAEYW
jgi:hypothetical protein